MASQFVSTSSGVSAFTEPKTWGWRCTSFFTASSEMSSSVKAAVFLRDAGVEDNLHEEVAQLLAEMGLAALVNGVYDLPGLLHDVVLEALVGLFDVPGAAARAAQDVYEADEILEAVFLFVFPFDHICTPLILCAVSSRACRPWG